ncbi:MAG: hypothetical protein QXS68_05805 [Candidatus Methanomethylicaceae archaeon]
MASASDILSVRRKTGATADEYSDSEIELIINQYPLPDSNGKLPNETGWTPRYDLNAAAADIWSERAAGLSSEYDFEADGASFQRSQKYEHAMKQARYYRSRCSTQTIQLKPYPKLTESTNDTE